jgi:hypothetical protein
VLHACRANPGGAWPYQTGQDFLPNHLVDGVDFASVHMWPDNWDRTDQAFGRTWLDAHMKDAYYLGKPVVLEEFGKAIGAARLPGNPGTRTCVPRNPRIKPSKKVPMPVRDAYFLGKPVVAGGVRQGHRCGACRKPYANLP